MTIATGIAVSAFVLAALALLLLVLIQKGRGTNLFLGGTHGHTVLGAKTAEALTWVTAGTFGLFLALAALVNRMVG